MTLSISPRTKGGKIQLALISRFLPSCHGIKHFFILSNTLANINIDDNKIYRSHIVTVGVQGLSLTWAKTFMQQRGTWKSRCVFMDTNLYSWPHHACMLSPHFLLCFHLVRLYIKMGQKQNFPQTLKYFICDSCFFYGQSTFLFILFS